MKCFNVTTTSVSLISNNLWHLFLIAIDIRHKTTQSRVLQEVVSRENISVRQINTAELIFSAADAVRNDMITEMLQKRQEEDIRALARARKWVSCSPSATIFTARVWSLWSWCIEKRQASTSSWWWSSLWDFIVTEIWWRGSEWEGVFVWCVLIQ